MHTLGHTYQCYSCIVGSSARESLYYSISGEYRHTRCECEVKDHKHTYTHTHTHTHTRARACAHTRMHAGAYTMPNTTMLENVGLNRYICTLSLNRVSSSHILVDPSALHLLSFVSKLLPASIHPMSGQLEFLTS